MQCLLGWMCDASPWAIWLWMVRCNRLPARAEHAAQFFERGFGKRRGPRIRHEPQTCGFLEFFECIRRLRDRALPHHRTEPLEQHRANAAGQRGDLRGDLRVAWPAVTNQRDVAHFHHVVRGDRRQYVALAPYARKRKRDEMRRMRMHDAARLAVARIDA